MQWPSRRGGTKGSMWPAESSHLPLGVGHWLHALCWGHSQGPVSGDPDCPPPALLSPAARLPRKLPCLPRREQEKRRPRGFLGCGDKALWSLSAQKLSAHLPARPEPASSDAGLEWDSASCWPRAAQRLSSLNPCLGEPQTPLVLLPSTIRDTPLLAHPLGLV